MGNPVAKIVVVIAVVKYIWSTNSSSLVKVLVTSKRPSEHTTTRVNSGQTESNFLARAESPVRLFRPTTWAHIPAA